MDIVQRAFVATTLWILFLSRILPQTDAADPKQADREVVEQLIAQLVSPNRDPNPDGNDINGFPFDYDKDAQANVISAHQKLRDLDKEAFPILIENLADHRYSMTIATSIPRSFSVGDACYLLIEQQVDVAGMRYISRKDAMGTSHTHEGFFDQFWRDDFDRHLKRQKRRGVKLNNSLHKNDYLQFRQKGLQKWWNEHKDRSLKEMQIEALNWAIERERMIGFPTKADEDKYLNPLVEILDELKQ